MDKQSTKETAARATAEVVGPPTRVVLRIIFIFLLVAVLLWVLVKLTGVILLLVLSIFFAYLVSPLVDFFRKPRTIKGRTIAIPKSVAILLSYVVILATIVVAIFVILPTWSNQFPEFSTQAKGYWNTLGERSTQLNEYFKSRRMPKPIVEAVDSAIPKLIEKVSATVSELVTSSFAYLTFLPWLVLIPILAFFLLKDAESFRRSALLMFPRGAGAGVVTNFFRT